MEYEVIKYPMEEGMGTLRIIPILQDNYSYLLSWNDQAIVIDPGASKEILALLKEEGLNLFSTLITHHHEDHIEGFAAMRERSDFQVVGPEDERIEGLTQTVEDGEELNFGPFSVDVIHTPGHTKSHVVYYFKNLKILFSGDTLFSAGCGKLLEGTADELYHSLQKIAELPGETQVFCGHEYTLANLEFALSLLPDDAAIQERYAEVKHLREENKPTMPTTLREEKRSNIFLRCEDPEVQKAIQMEGEDPVDVFARLRKLKDEFKGSEAT